ncbi:DUF397 domain-containing protein [Streptomyces sp. NPDC050619]|uniref:DUF397 domain-containing protein n=1 Tax=Streptomyces sp. NPDC050619 TaxID=3157214 RepID=UPI003424BA06
MSEIVWQKSSYSGSGDGTNCVELATTEDILALRESDAPTVVLHTHRLQLAALLWHIKANSPSARP